MSKLRDIADSLSWYEPPDPTPRHTCPCCDYVTLPERGNYLICPVCYWEDDGVGVHRLDAPSGPNAMSLREGRANFKRNGACSESCSGAGVPADERACFEHRPRDLS
jgi:hypothetical protein